jgi:hypothetical protein
MGFSRIANNAGLYPPAESSSLCGEARLKPHEQLLLACATSHRSEPARQGLESALTSPGFDWPRAIRASIVHGLAQHLAFHAQDFNGDPRLPEGARSCLESVLRANGRRNTVLFELTGRLVTALEGAGITAIVLKGVALALSVYPDHALRNFSDVDILVDSAQHQEAIRVAEQIGFVLEGPEDPGPHRTCIFECREDILTETLAPEFDRSLTPELLAKHCHRAIFEIHRGVFRDAAGRCRTTDTRALMEAPDRASLPDGTPFLTLSPEAQLVHVCAHASEHAFSRLTQVVDIVNLVGTFGAEMDWDRVAWLSCRYQVSTPVFMALDLASREFGAPIPNDALSAVRREMPRRYHHRPFTTTDLFAMAEGSKGAQTYFRWRIASGFRERLILARHILMPPRPYQEVKGPFRTAFYYLSRPVQIAVKLARILSVRVLNGRNHIQ